MTEMQWANPNAAWLVVACDMPDVQDDSMSRLIEGRDATRYATVFDQTIINPVFAIYEPKIYPILQKSFAMARQLLMASAQRGSSSTAFS